MSHPPVPFIVGCGRSGTTLLRAMLDAHPEIAVPPEAQFLVPTIRARTRFEGGGHPLPDAILTFLQGQESFRRWGLPEREVEVALAPAVTVPEALRGLYRTYAARERKLRYADKTPFHVHSLRLLGAAFPEARFVHLIRDGRDVAVSRVASGFRPPGIVGAARAWRAAIRRSRAAGRRLGHRYLEVRYEKLVADPETQIRRLCGFASLDFDDSTLSYFGEVRPPARDQPGPAQASRSTTDDADARLATRAVGRGGRAVRGARRRRAAGHRIRALRDPHPGADPRPGGPATRGMERTVAHRPHPGERSACRKGRRGGGDVRTTEPGSPQSYVRTWRP